MKTRTKDDDAQKILKKTQKNEQACLQENEVKSRCEFLQLFSVLLEKPNKQIKREMKIKRDKRQDPVLFRPCETVETSSNESRILG